MAEANRYETPDKMIAVMKYILNFLKKARLNNFIIKILC